MKTVSVREARQQMGNLLDAVIAGEKIIITRRGKPIAKLTVVEPEDAENCFPDRTQFRAMLPINKSSSAEMLREMRNERG